MGRPKNIDNKNQINLTIDYNLNSELEDYISKIGITKTKYIEYVLKKHKDKNENKFG